jgi:hypothetical protein
VAEKIEQGSYPNVLIVPAGQELMNHRGMALRKCHKRYDSYRRKAEHLALYLMHRRIDRRSKPIRPCNGEFWMFALATGFFPSSLVPAHWRALYGFNPMAGVIEGFRWALTGHGRPPDSVLFVSAGMVLVMLFGGLLYFNKMESTIADVV